MTANLYLIHRGTIQCSYLGSREWEGILAIRGNGCVKADFMSDSGTYLGRPRHNPSNKPYRFDGMAIENCQISETASLANGVKISIIVVSAGYLQNGSRSGTR